ncbi:uncharacterized protein LOC62_04G006372 [Vanrija pseudolonga]|uniref:Uncharacterized protein n=1 Tax=Vanrija pseudolonga TaxID=143232 RepID=A0AAF0YE77_9TREE|nr:hypothetical protein LOC62_04G006372 [Vanrija pseudolonga]
MLLRRWRQTKGAQQQQGCTAGGGPRRPGPGAGNVVLLVADESDGASRTIGRDAYEVDEAHGAADRDGTESSPRRLAASSPRSWQASFRQLATLGGGAESPLASRVAQALGTVLYGGVVGDCSFDSLPRNML